MIKLFALFSFLFFISISYAQTNSHPTINSFMLKFEDGSPSIVSTVMDSSVIINYVIELKDTIDISKIYVRISSGADTTGNMLQVNYQINSLPILNILGKCVFKREELMIYIQTITSTQLSELNFEVATENNLGQLTPYLNWKN